MTGGIAHLLVGDGVAIPMLIAPMGASAVLLFAMPASPLAQPWSIIGGNLVSAFIGVSCAFLVHDSIDAAAQAVGIAICAMFALRCVHPPSGAVALTAVLGGPPVHSLGYGFVLAPVFIQSGVLMSAAIIFHALTGHRFPHRHAVSNPVRNSSSVASFTRADLDTVLARRNELLDVDPDDLESLLRETQLRAYARGFVNVTCADIMSHAVVAISPGASAHAALSLIARHRVKALPVVDMGRGVVGIVTRIDLMAADVDRLARLVERILGGRPSALRTVASLMTSEVRSVRSDMTLDTLVPIFADYGHHHIPVLDYEQRLVGMITEADLIAGLYRHSFTTQGAHTRPCSQPPAP
jgi:CBS domain-containing membrane protein